MKKPSGAEPLPSGDPYSERPHIGKNIWDDRMGDAAARNRQWRSVAFAASVVALSAIGGMTYEYNHRDPRMIVVTVRDRFGDVVSTARGDGQVSEPTTADLTSGLKHWLRDVRSLTTDADAITANIKAAYRLVEPGSIAYATLNTFYRDNDPFKHGKTEIVHIDALSALPTPGTPDTSGNRTWTLQWAENTLTHDGTIVSVRYWQMSVTFHLATVDTPEDVEANPDGVAITDFHWSVK